MGLESCGSSGVCLVMGAEWECAGERFGGVEIHHRGASRQSSTKSVGVSGEECRERRRVYGGGIFRRAQAPCCVGVGAGLGRKRSGGGEAVCYHGGKIGPGTARLVLGAGRWMGLESCGSSGVCSVMGRNGSARGSNFGGVENSPPQRGGRFGRRVSCEGGGYTGEGFFGGRMRRAALMQGRVWGGSVRGGRWCVVGGKDRAGDGLAHAWGGALDGVGVSRKERGVFGDGGNVERARGSDLGCGKFPTAARWAFWEKSVVRGGRVHEGGIFRRVHAPCCVDMGAGLGRERSGGRGGVLSRGKDRAGDGPARAWGGALEGVGILWKQRGMFCDGAEWGCAGEQFWGCGKFPTAARLDQARRSRWAFREGERQRR